MTSISISISSVLIVTSVVPQMKTILFLFLLAFALVLIFRLALYRICYRCLHNRNIQIAHTCLNDGSNDILAPFYFWLCHNVPVPCLTSKYASQLVAKPLVCQMFRKLPLRLFRHDYARGYHVLHIHEWEIITSLDHMHHNEGHILHLHIHMLEAYWTLLQVR